LPHAGTEIPPKSNSSGWPSPRPQAPGARPPALNRSRLAASESSHLRTASHSAVDRICRLQGRKPVIGCFNERPNRPQHARLAGNSLHSCRRGAAVRSEKASRSCPWSRPEPGRIQEMPGMSSSASFAILRPKSMLSQPLTSSLISPFESHWFCCAGNFAQHFSSSDRCGLWRRRSRGAFSPRKLSESRFPCANKKPWAGHPLRKACFLLGRESGGRAGFCRGVASLPYGSI
jgi:hypothetical protein